MKKTKFIFATFAIVLLLAFTAGEAKAQMCTYTLTNNVDCEISYEITFGLPCPPQAPLAGTLCPGPGHPTCPNNSVTFQADCNCPVIIKLKDRLGNVLITVSNDPSTGYPSGGSFTNPNCNVGSNISLNGNNWVIN
ncbi:MAG: hypothetical protein M3Q97_09895 [Bacteroidota bacterium]|nr:hypothetical protein [Bacteroidota bacterium]